MRQRRGDEATGQRGKQGELGDKVESATTTNKLTATNGDDGKRRTEATQQREREPHVENVKWRLKPAPAAGAVSSSSSSSSSSGAAAANNDAKAATSPIVALEADVSASVAICSQRQSLSLHSTSARPQQHCSCSARLTGASCRNGGHIQAADS
ncbi:hypothetical protein AWZ03_010718 [Drosophila navojoa]|uniref:Uncharacterized protein n=1 Tax=Drosophila navojoa TaxID=7232 RepID=A0A484B4W3_DRONA|nr:hypothetical protein AWZ03_010718 [Drosophila navojoa]